MSEEKQEVFRGHIDECLKHLGAILPKNSHGAGRVREPIAGFCGVTVQTVTRWLNGSLFPAGEILIRLICYLDLVGYRIIELERMPRFRRNFLELIGFRMISVASATEFLGYTETTTLYKVLQGKQGLGESKKQLMWEKWKERKEELERKKDEAFAQYHLKSLEVKPAISIYRRPAIVNITEALLVMLEEEPPEKPSGLTGSLETVRKLSERLSALSRSDIPSRGTEVADE